MGVDLKNQLNNWMYGPAMGGLLQLTKLFRKPERIIETLTQECTECGVSLETFITEKREGIPSSSFHVVRCSACRTLNLLDNGANIARSKFGEYESVELLRKDAYDHSQALERMRQIAQWRK